jgi:hypothetical protein
MHRTRRIVSMLTLLLAIGLCAEASAQSSEAPYTARKATIDELIQTGEFDESPLSLPFELKDSRSVAVYGRTDFEHYYDTPKKEIVALFEDARKNRKELQILDDTVDGVDGDKVKVIGSSKARGRRNFTLIVPATGRKFVVEIGDADKGGTVVVVRNVVITSLYSGVVPARFDFAPIDAKAIPLRWN